MSENTAEAPRKKNPLLVLLDGFTLVLWKIVEFPFLLLYLILRGTGNMFSGIWKAIGELDGAAWYWKPLNRFFMGLGKFFGILFYVPCELLRVIVKGMDKSAGLRRFLLLLLIAVAAFWVYLWGPQPTWGKWHPYYDATANRYPGKLKLRKTASGEWVVPQLVFTAAHPDLPLGSRVLLENPDNDRKIAVRINDRRDQLYLSEAAAWKLGIFVDGVTIVKVSTRDKLLDDPEPVKAPDSTQVPTGWVDELQPKPFTPNVKEIEPEDEPEPAPAPAPVVKKETPPPPALVKVVPPPAPVAKKETPAPAPPVVKKETPPPATPAPVVKKETPKPAPAPKKEKIVQPPPSPASDDHFNLNDPVLVPDRRGR